MISTEAIMIDNKIGTSDLILDNPCPWNLGARQQKLLP